MGMTRRNSPSFAAGTEAELAAETGQAALAQLEQALLLDARKGHAYFWKSLACACLAGGETRMLWRPSCGRKRRSCRYRRRSSLPYAGWNRSDRTFIECMPRYS